MKLVSFSAKSYRSISAAYKLPLGDFTVIVGPNNEGKSNILKAFALGLNILSGSRNIRFTRTIYPISSSRLIERFDYNWFRDYPLNQQVENPNGKSEFTYEFELSSEEFSDFRDSIKINLTTNLKANIVIGNEGFNIDFLMKGKGKASLNKKKDEIAVFINKKIALQYIPAIRTADIAINIVDNLLEQELSILEEDPNFQAIVTSLQKLQQPIIRRISKNLKDTISSFIPDVSNISIKNKENVSKLISASCKIYINDGTETDLQLKGDGVISLTAIALLQYFSKKRSLEKGFILLLEEPESHLHPRAIQNLKEVLSEISKTNQVVVTTHSPILVNRSNIRHNILVQSGKAVPAREIKEIRDSLGITLSDNLSSAYLVILVEGEEDIIILNAILRDKSSKLNQALENAMLIFDQLGGATNLAYKSSYYKNNLCNIIAFLDDDKAGRQSVEHAIEKGTLKNNEYILSCCKGMPESEIEDLLELGVYNSSIKNEFGVDLNIPAFKNNKLKWSDRAKEIFRLNGKIWSNAIEMKAKYLVANAASKLGYSAINQHKSNSIDKLIEFAEVFIEKRR